MSNKRRFACAHTRYLRKYGDTGQDELHSHLSHVFYRAMNAAESRKLLVLLKENLLLGQGPASDAEMAEFLGTSRTAISKMRKSEKLDSVHMTNIRTAFPTEFQKIQPASLVVSGMLSVTSRLRELMLPAPPTTAIKITLQEYLYSLAVFVDNDWKDVLEDFEQGRTKAASILRDWGYEETVSLSPERSIYYLLSLLEEWSPFSAISLGLFYDRIPVPPALENIHE